MAQSFLGQKRLRKYYGKIREVLEMPNLIEADVNEYQVLDTFDLARGFHDSNNVEDGSSEEDTEADEFEDEALAALERIEAQVYTMATKADINNVRGELLLRMQGLENTMSAMLLEFKHVCNKLHERREQGKRAGQSSSEQRDYISNTVPDFRLGR